MLFNRQEERRFPNLRLDVSNGAFTFKPVLLRFLTPVIFERNVPSSTIQSISKILCMKQFGFLFSWFHGSIIKPPSISPISWWFNYKYEPMVDNLTGVTNEGFLTCAPDSSNRGSLPKKGMSHDVRLQSSSRLRAGYRTHAMPTYGLPAIFPLIMILAQT